MLQTLPSIAARAIGGRAIGGRALATVLGALAIGAAATSYAPPAAAQGMYSKNGVPMDGARNCPTRWDQGSSRKNSLQKPDHCYPRYDNSPKIYRNTNGCAPGYAADGMYWCTEGYVEQELARGNAIPKQGLTDRCPAGFHTYKDKCTSDYAKTAKARPKGKGACKSNEVEEWGIWCVSDYQHLTKHNLTSAALRDWNNIYTFSGGKRPTQGPDSKDKYSEVYIALYGQPEPEAPQPLLGLPVPGAGGEAQAAEGGCDQGKAAIGQALGGLFGNGGAAAAAVAQKALGC